MIKKLLLLLLLLTTKSYCQVEVTVNGYYDYRATIINYIPGPTLPGTPFLMHWFDSTDYTYFYQDPNYEDVNVTNVSTSGTPRFQVVRGYNGTIALNHSTGSVTYSMISGTLNTFTPTPTKTPTSIPTSTPTNSFTQTPPSALAVYATGTWVVNIGNGVTIYYPTSTNTPTFTVTGSPTATPTSTPTDIHVYQTNVPTYDLVVLTQSPVPQFTQVPGYPTIEICWLTQTPVPQFTAVPMATTQAVSEVWWATPPPNPTVQQVFMVPPTNTNTPTYTVTGSPTATATSTWTPQSVYILTPSIQFTQVPGYPTFQIVWITQTPVAQFTQVPMATTQAVSEVWWATPVPYYTAVPMATVQQVFVVLPTSTNTPTATVTGSATPTPTSTWTPQGYPTYQIVIMTQTPPPQFTAVPMATTQGVSVTNPVVQFTQVPIPTAVSTPIVWDIAVATAVFGMNGKSVTEDTGHVAFAATPIVWDPAVATAVVNIQTPVYGWNTQKAVSVTGIHATGIATTLVAPVLYKYWTLGTIGTGGSGAVTTSFFPQVGGNQGPTAVATVISAGNATNFGASVINYLASGMAASISGIAASTTITVMEAGSN